MADQVPIERGVPKAVRRRNHIVGVLVGALVIVAAAALVIAALALGKLNALEDDSHRAACSDRLVADFAAATGRALAAPPAPNAERIAAVTDITRASERLAHSDRICAHGVPAPLEPTPVKAVTP